MTPDRSGLRAQLAEAGYALLPAATACATLQLDLAALDALRDSWERLPRDAYLRDGGNYRARRHGCFVQTPAAGLPEALPHKPAAPARAVVAAIAQVRIARQPF